MSKFDTPENFRYALQYALSHYDNTYEESVEGDTTRISPYNISDASGYENFLTDRGIPVEREGSDIIIPFTPGVFDAEYYYDAGAISAEEQEEMEAGA